LSSSFQTKQVSTSPRMLDNFHK